MRTKIRVSPESAPRYHSAITAALIAEGSFMLMVAMVAWLRGNDPWKVVKIPATFVLGPEVVEPAGFVPSDVLWGLLAHLVASILVGVLYAYLLPRLRLSPVVGGLVAATIMYILGFWILPQLFPEWLAPFWLPPVGRLLQAVAHVVYGLVLGFSYGWLVER